MTKKTNKTEDAGLTKEGIEKLHYENKNEFINAIIENCNQFIRTQNHLNEEYKKFVIDQENQ